MPLWIDLAALQILDARMDLLAGWARCLLTSKEDFCLVFFGEASSASEQPCDIGVVSRRVSVYRHIGMKNFFVQPALCMGLCIFSVSCCIDAAQQRRQPTARSRSTRPARQTYFCDSGPVCAWTSEPL